MDCLFDRIVKHEIKSEVVYQDDLVTAFRDINPQAPVHILIVPNEHIPSVLDLKPEHAEILSRLMQVAAELAEREGIARGGFRLIFNTGPNAGQTVDHLHMHLLGGRAMGWPPG